MPSSVGIVGYGDLGRALHALFPAAAIYDEPLNIGTRDEVNACRFAFVCVPTPPQADGACDTSIVEHVVRWLESEYVVIHSTVVPGTTERLQRETGKRIVFQPAFGPGATPDHPYRELHNLTWVVLGGEHAHTAAVADLYKTVYGADIIIRQTDTRTAELTKYMENAFLALKVTFCNQFYDIAAALGVDYDDLRELLLLDPRVGRSHTFVYPDDRGYGGKCLPKDVLALMNRAAEAGADVALLEAMVEVNRSLRARQDAPSA